MQSRYYNPDMGRFISADSFASTGQGVLGYNMYAYCKNNPISLSDPSGEIPVIDAYIHREVLSEIAQNNPSLSDKWTCVRYRDDNGEYTGKWGFCDLYNTNTGEVWELKKNSNSKSCRTQNAIIQLENYINGTLLWNPKLMLTKPSQTQIPDGRTRRDTLFCTYEINYWNEGNGILRYDYNVSINTGSIASAFIVGIALMTGVSSIGVAGAIGIGGLLPA